MKKALLASILAVLLGATAIVAAPGSIPIYQQTVITQPGDYVVTRDIEVSSGYAIEIQSDDVVLDLNGHKITSTSVDDAVVYLGASNRVVIRNGRTQGGMFGIRTVGTTGVTVRLEKLVVSDTVDTGASLLGALHVEVLSCIFSHTGHIGIYASSPNGQRVSGQIVDNSILKPGNRGITLYSANGFLIRGNVIAESSSSCMQIETLVGGSPEVGGNIIEGNSCRWMGSGIFPADGIYLHSNNNRVVGNSIEGYSSRAILVQGDGNLIADNVIAGTISIGMGVGDGISVYQGQRNLIEGNQVEGNAACGIRFDATAGANAYRNNMLRGNTGGAICDTGTGNTSEGGNIY